METLAFRSHRDEISRKQGPVKTSGRCAAEAQGGAWVGRAGPPRPCFCLPLLAPPFLRRYDMRKSIKLPLRATRKGWSLTYIAEDNRTLRIKDLQS